MISLVAGLALFPADSGEDAAPEVHVRFSHGLSPDNPAVEVNIV